MRRIQSTHLPGFLSRGESPPRPASSPAPWRASFELRSITPVLGGGVRSFEPDQVDFVRVPAIRGQLRWWWRGLFQKAGVDPNMLFAQEARLWGGVGVPGHGREGDKEPPGLRSRVRITAEILDRGKVKPAGFHEWGNGQLKAVPHWTIGSGLGYALFPLQRSKDERKDYQRQNTARPEKMPTRFVSLGLRFHLHVSVVGGEPGGAPSQEDVTQVLASLWAWISFGGLGARARRGFGALELKELSDLAGAPDAATWSRLFRGPDSSGVLSWLKDFERIASPRGVLWPCEILTGHAIGDAARVHEELIGHLKYFRQSPGFARDPGPGESRWPEPDLVRVLAPPGPRFSHEPSAETVKLVEAGQMGAPRAAFGLPIQIKFKDAADERANATLLPPGAKRWPSPLLLRPIRRASGDYLPAAILLPISPPAKVELEYAKPGEEETKEEKEKNVCLVAKSAGAQLDIAKFLNTTKGDALEAFVTWLEDEKRFDRISLPPKGAPRA